MTTPKVSICCLCYNHEKYIRQCLDGIIMQQTSFPFEALVHDDNYWISKMDWDECGPDVIFKKCENIIL